MNARILVVLALALTLWPPLTAQAQTDDDARLQAEILRSVRDYPRLTIFDHVEAAVQDGVVVLNGKVTMPFKRDEIASRIGTLAGIRELHNGIAVLPVSIADDELRKRVARAIYGNPAFRRFAAMPVPPIHIVVEHGRVTLAGMVPSDVDRMLARSLASGQGERSVICTLRTDAERQ